MKLRTLLSTLLISAITTSAASYEINYPTDTTIDASTRHLDGISLTSEKHGEQSATVSQATDNLLYHDLSATARFNAVAGEVVTAAVDWSSSWMNAYAYIDYNNDGEFDVTTELVTFSNYDGVNAIGASSNNNTANACVAMPSFVIPSNLAAGEYRIRYVIDWNYKDPKGRNTTDNSIVANNGAIADATLVVEAAATVETPYAINYEEDATLTHSSRRLTAINFAVSNLPTQTLTVGQNSDNKLYHDFTTNVLAVAAGSTVSITFDWSGTWMCSYVYLDRCNDGDFNTAIDSSTGRPLPGSDVMAYSYYNGVNSKGTTNTGENVTPPSFTIPADLTPGTYRMRIKIDWDSLDPAGNTTDGNDILKNGGAITDLTIMVAERVAGGIISAYAENGEILLTDNSELNGTNVPTSGNLEFITVPANGYQLDGITIASGLTAPENTEFISSAVGRNSFTVMPLNADENGVFAVDIAQLFGDPEIRAIFIKESEAPKGGNYESEYTADKTADSGITAVAINGKSITVESESAHCFVEQTLYAPVGSQFTPEVTYSGNTASEFKFFIDLDQDGEFYDNTTSLSCELLASATSASALDVQLPSSLPAGVYRARIEAAGHCDVEFLLNVYNSTSQYTSMAKNGIILSSNNGVLGETTTPFTVFSIRALPTLSGFETDSIIVRHGQNVNGAPYIAGNRQWIDTKIKLATTGVANIPADIVDGDIVVYALFEETADSEWTKVWGDEFNDGELDTDRWNYHPRYTATWNRLIAQGEEQQALTNTFENGAYNAHAIPTPAQFTDETQSMISGAIYSQGLFGMTYGKVEARIKTTPHTGNFPAFWMMPVSAAPEVQELGLSGWPQNGEIDIWEQINTDNKSHHTVHSAWTGWKDYLQGGSSPWPEPVVKSPTSTCAVATDATQWHVFALEWEAEELRWYVDGTHVFTYANQHYTEEDVVNWSTERITWPFDKDFYIILNQSVGNGGWAASPDTSFSYLTKFDYVRVYQKKDGSQTNSTSFVGNGDDPNFYVPAEKYDSETPDTEGAIKEIVADETIGTDGTTVYFDLNGRRICPLNLTPGIYIVKTGNSTTKILVK